MRRLLVPFVALLAVSLFFAEYLPGRAQVHIFSDLEIFHYPLQRYAFQSLQEGRIPQWDPSMYCGIAYAGNPQAALFYPPMWLLYGLNSGRATLTFRALELFALAHVWLAFVLCYFWLQGRGLHPLGCAFGAGVFAFGGYLMWQIVHLGVLMGLPWMPLAFQGIDESVERQAWPPLWKTALASALWFLAGYPPSWAAFCVTVVIYALAGRSGIRSAVGAVGAIAASMILATVQVLPALEASSGIFPQVRYTSTPGSTILPLFVANWFDSNPNSPHNYLECLYIYWGLPAAFAILVLLAGRSWRPHIQPIALLGACLVLVQDPGHLIYYTIVHVPIFERTLQSYNFYEGASAAAALLTASALSSFLKRVPRRIPPRWSWILVLVAAGAWEARQIIVFAGGGSFASGIRAVLATAVGLAIFGVGMLVLRAQSGARRSLLAGALLLFIFVDYKVYGTERLFNTRNGNVDEFYPPSGIHGVSDEAYAVLQKNRQYRVTSDGAPASMDFRMWGLATPQGVDPLLSDRYKRLVLQLGARFESLRLFTVDYRNREMLDLLGVRYAISYSGGPQEAMLASDPDFRRIGPDAFYHVYEYLKAQPPYRWDGTSGEIRLTGWLPEHRAFQVQSGGGRFVLVEQNFPGWRASIDGSEAPIALWHGVFQSIDIPPGAHSIVFDYRSRWLPLGAAISLAAVIALGLVIRQARSPKTGD